MELTEERLREIIREEILKEMPYERSDYVSDVNMHAQKAYEHFCKIFLYRNSTNDASGWADEIVNSFVIPMLTAKVYVSDKAKRKVLINGFQYNGFGSDMSDYQTRMETYSKAAISAMNDKARKCNQKEPAYYDPSESIRMGYPVVEGFCRELNDLAARSADENTARTRLQRIIRTSLSRIFGMNC